MQLIHIKRLLAILSLALPAFGQAVSVTKVWVTDISHSVVLVNFNSTGVWNYLRIRYVQSPGTCTKGSGGSLVLTGYSGQLHPNSGMTQPVGGLLPNTSYQMCPEVSADNQKWSSGVGEAVTTLPLPNPHPALPIPPAKFNTDYPNTAGYNSVSIASDCHDLSSALKTALANQMTKGTVVNIPAGTVCSGQYFLDQQAADAVSFTSAAVNTSRSTITIARHGYPEGQGLVFGTHYGCAPGSSLRGNDCHTSGSGPIVPGQLYYAHVIDANTIQVYDGKPKESGGQLCTFSNAGSGTMLVVKWPRPLKWIVIRTATPSDQFTPEHVRVNPAWAPKMAVLQMPVSYLGPANHNVLFEPNDEDGALMSMNANIRVVGIEFTYAPNPESPLSSNSVPHHELVHTNQTNQNIIFDRCYFHGLPPPDRVTRAFWWNGINQAIVDSYIDGMQFYHPIYSGLTIKQVSKNQFTIAPGTYHFGAGSASLKNTVTVNTTGNSGSSSMEGFVYFTIDGQLNIVLPPGMNGTCSGYSRCHVFAGTLPGDGSPANGVFNLSTNSLAFPNNSNGAAANYLIDPVTSSSNNCSDTTSLFDNYAITPIPLTSFGGARVPANFGVRFSSEKPAFACGIRFYKNSIDSTKTHTVALWNSSGGLLAQGNSTRETSSGWQQAKFSSPIALSASATYTASVLTPAGYYITNFFLNYQFDHGTLHAPAAYANTNGTCNFSDSWAKDFLGNTAGAQVACIAFGSGSIAAVANADPMSNQYDSEGCQCMIGGIGPGPYAFINNYVEGSGLVWHHDDSGEYWSHRGDYYYTRNTFHVPLSHMYGGPQSDGLRYFHRQALEWKAGQRILLDGNVFDGAWTEDTPYGGFISLSSIFGQGIRDVDIRNNTFQHGASMIFPPSAITTTAPKPAPPIRFRFQNNLAWDINGFTYCTHGQGFCPEGGAHGVIFGGSQGAEDWTIDHNTILGNVGAQPSLLWMSETRVEGMNFTNNIFYLSPGYGEGIAAGNVLGLKGTKCGELFGKAAADCALQNYVFEHNLLTGTESRGTIRSWWPGLNNYVPPKPPDLSQLGAFVRDSVGSGEQFRPKSGSCQGCGNPEKDLKDFGVDMDALDAAQGKVKRVEVPASSISSTSAVVKFTAPDKFGCEVDYSSSDRSLINSFKRVQDPGGETDRAITLSNLSGGTTYYYRINCAVQQPKGQFQTH
jgi:hypothetical protein